MKEFTCIFALLQEQFSDILFVTATWFDDTSHSYTDFHVMSVFSLVEEIIASSLLSSILNVIVPALV